MDYKVPETWDWIRSRSECSIQQMFTLLVQRIESDVKDMEALARARQAGSVFTLNRVSDRQAIVGRKDDMGGVFQGRGVAFERIDNSVRVYTVGPGQDATILTATPD